MFCPHCEKVIPTPPDAWSWLPPWQCSHCAGLFGVSIKHGGFRIPAGIKPLWPLFTWQEARNFGFYAGRLNYVYALCYPSGLPFYVGRGVRYRACTHIDETWDIPQEQWTEKHHLIVSLSERNESEWYHFLALVETKGEAAAIEQTHIQKWGVRHKGGLLVNHARPIAYPHIGELPKPPIDMRAIETETGPRSVHHPAILLGEFSKREIEINCPTCLKQCKCPRSLAANRVQCAYCAHFFIPINPSRQQHTPELFIAAVS